MTRLSSMMHHESHRHTQRVLSRDSLLDGDLLHGGLHHAQHVDPLHADANHGLQECSCRLRPTHTCHACRHLYFADQAILVGVEGVVDRVDNSGIVASRQRCSEVLLHLITGQASITIGVQHLEVKSIWKVTNKLLHLLPDNAAWDKVPLTHQLPLRLSILKLCILDVDLLHCILGLVHEIWNCNVAIITSIPLRLWKLELLSLWHDAGGHSLFT